MAISFTHLLVTIRTAQFNIHYKNVSMIIHDQALMFSRVHVNGTPIGAHQAVSTNRSETVDVSAPSLPRLFAFFGAVLMDMGCDPAAVSV